MAYLRKWCDKNRLKFQSIVSVCHVKELHPYVGLLTFAAFSFAINFGLVLSKYLVFEYDDTSGIVGWVSVHQYPKHQEFFYYLLAVIGVPVLIGASVFVWVVFSRWAAKRCGRSITWMLKAAALASLPLCLSWCTVFLATQKGLMPFVLPFGVSLLVTFSILFFGRIKGGTPTGASSTAFLESVETDNPFDAITPSDKRNIGAGHPSRKKRVCYGVLAYIVLPFFIYLLTYQCKVHGGIDRFHEGEFLAPLNEMLRGGIPFRDIYLQHGLFENALLPWVGSQLFEPTLMGVRLMREALVPLGYIALYLLSLQIFRSRSFTVVSSVLIASGIWVSSRYTFGLLAFACVVNDVTHRQKGGQLQGETGFQNARFAWKLILAGFFTSFAFWYSAEIGIYSLASIGLFFCLYRLHAGIPTGKRLLLLINYTCGVMIGLLPVGLYLLWHGALDDAVQNTYIQCRYQLATWGLPFPSLSALLVTWRTEGWHAFLFDSHFQYYLPICVFLSVGAYLTFRGVCGTLWQSAGMMKLLLLWIGGIVFFRTALGRSDPGHLAYGSTFFWLLCMFTVERGLFRLMNAFFSKSSDSAPLKLSMSRSCGSLVRKASWILIPTVIFFGYVAEVYQPLTLFRENGQRLIQHPFRQRVAEVALERAGRVDIPDVQAQQMQKVVAYLQDQTSPDEKIFDFSSQGAYYFFANRPSVTRYHQVAYAATPAMQREVIEALEADSTRIVLFKTGGWFDAVDNIPAEKRHPIIAAYLQANYEPAVYIYRTQILQRKGP